MVSKSGSTIRVFQPTRRRTESWASVGAGYHQQISPLTPPLPTPPDLRSDGDGSGEALPPESAVYK